MGKTVTIDVIGIDQIKKDLVSIAKTKRLEQAIVIATSDVEGAAKALCPTNKFGHSAKPLNTTIHHTVKNYGDEIVGRVYSNSDHAIYVEFGTGQKGGTHPKSAEMGFSYEPNPWVYTPDDGEHFYTTTGMVARPYMYPALQQKRTRINKLIEDALRNEI